MKEVIICYIMRNMKALPEKISYHLIFDKEADGGYTVTVPAISGCITYGATFEEATQNIREAILLCLEDILDRGEAIPNDANPIISSIELSPAELHA